MECSFPCGIWGGPPCPGPAVRDFAHDQHPRGPRRDVAGLTLIELVVVICIIGICAAILVDRLRYYQEAAEKGAMEYSIAAMKSALQLRIAAMLVRGEQQKIESLARGNPVEWLTEPPRGYRGEFLAAEPKVSGASWYYDTGQRELVYVPGLDAHLHSDAAEKRLRFRVELEYEPEASAQKRGKVTGARIVPVTKYAWF